MNYTIQTIINDALGLIGVKASGETLNSDDSNEALRALNFMINSWGARNVSVRATVEEIFTLIANTRTYTIGSTGIFSTVRPQSLITAGLQFPADNIVLPIDIIGPDHYDSFSSRLVVTGPPTHVFYNPQMPNGVLHFFPIPDQGYTFRLRSAKALSEFPLLSTTFQLELTYIEAIVYNLAVRLAPRFGVEPSQLVLGESERLFNVILSQASPDMETGIDFAVIRPGVNPILIIE